MRRRTFLKAGVTGMALTLAQQASRAQVEPRADVKGANSKDTDSDLSVVVIGTDGSLLDKAIVDKYLAAHADVWHYLPNLAQFSQVLEFFGQRSAHQARQDRQRHPGQQAGGQGFDGRRLAKQRGARRGKRQRLAIQPAAA